ncbi:MAG: agmatinase [Nannocystaceae bacterium]|nr:agmatinase [Myxococcales bacterium]
MPQQPASHYLRHGQTPFFRLPVVDFTRAGADAYAGADAILLGVPWDAGVTYRPGARFAPYELRRVSALVQSYHPGHRLDVFGALDVRDGGNVAFPPFNAAATRELITAEVGHVLEAGATPFVVGGDHSVALPTMRALAAVHGPLAVVHLDAHLDTSTAEVWGEPFHHGTPLRHAIEQGLVERGALHQVGIRATWGAADEGDLVAAHGATIYTMERIEEQGIARVARTIREAVGERPVYLSLDVDGVDPAYAPGTGTPVPGGLSSREALRLLRELAGVNLVGADLVEVAPGLDHADITLHLGAHLLYEALALRALRRR